MSRSRRDPMSTSSDAAEEFRRRAVEEYLTAMTRRHQPRSPIEHRAEVVVAAQFRLTCRDPHPDRQSQRSLRVHRGIDRGTWRRERRAHPVAGVFEQPAVVRCNGRTHQLVVSR